MSRLPVLLLAAAVAACGGPTLSADQAERLAGRADDVAALIREGRACAARQETVRLRRTARERRQQGRLPAAVAGEIIEVADGLAAELEGACGGDVPATPSPLPESTGGDADDGDEGDDPGRGGDEGPPERGNDGEGPPGRGNGGEDGGPPGRGNGGDDGDDDNGNGGDD